MVGVEKETADKITKGATYQETYSMRIVGGGISTSVPKAVVERRARELGLTTEKFLETHEIVAYFDDFKQCDLVYKFQKKEDKR